MNNLYGLYVRAWENCEDEEFMSVLNAYFRKTFDRFEIRCLNEFYDDYYIEAGEETFQILKYGEPDKVVWEGKNLTGDVIKRIVERLII